MNSIENKLWTHLSFDDEKRNYNTEVRSSDGRTVLNYSDLVASIGRIAFHNPTLNLYYRGQGADYRDSRGQSSLYPTIFRPNKNDGHQLSKSKLARRFKVLEKASDLLRNNYHLIGKYKLHKFNEISWAILQHYEVCNTPLLDLSSSIHVAASFAYHNNSDTGHIFIFGIPHINGSISYFTDEELLNIKLQSICPPNALRPLFQDGHLVGTFPNRRLRNSNLNFSRRLVAKFTFAKDRFWNEHFRPIPREALYPQNDDVLRLAISIKADLNKAFGDDLN